jgi:hypothetical protein
MAINIGKFVAIQNSNDHNAYDICTVNGVGQREYWCTVYADFFISLGFWRGQDEHPERQTFAITETG